MKTMGVLGGLGPETTANFYMEVIKSCAKINKIQRPSILIANVPMVLKTEEKFINHSTERKKFLELILVSAKMLEKGGADFIVIPCNSAHLFIEEIRSSVNVPVVSIIDESVNFMSKQGIKSVAILATPTTIKTKLFDEKFRKKGIIMEKPNDQDQKEIGNIVNKILNKTEDQEDKWRLENIINKFSSELILLACTDLHILIKPNHKIFDTMQILKNSAIRELHHS